MPRLANGARRIHGLQLPLDRMQILAWSLVASSIVLFFCLCVPFLPENEVRWSFLGAYLLVLVVGFPIFFVLSLSDMAHDKFTVPNYEENDANVRDPFNRCHFCDVYSAKGTKHCRLCNKCVPGFDHHCLYLNTCVGEKNYRLFFSLVSAITSLTAIHVIAVVWLILKHNSDEYKGLVEGSIFPSVTAYIATLATTAMIPAGGFAGVFSLLAFHVYITIKGVSTYDWIIQRRDAKMRAKEMRALAKRNKKVTAKQAEIRRKFVEDQEKRKRLKKGSKSVAPSTGGRSTARVEPPKLPDAPVSATSSLRADDARLSGSTETDLPVTPPPATPSSLAVPTPEMALSPSAGDPDDEVAAEMAWLGVADTRDVDREQQDEKEEDV